MAHTHRYLPPAGHRLLLPLYDLVSRLAGAPVLHARLVEQAGIQPGHRVLDLGCGPGAVALRIARHHPDADVVGLDPDHDALRHARRKGARAGVDIEWQQGYAEEMPFADGSFDRVVSSLALHHVDAGAVEAALRETLRVLRPGGRLHVADFAGDGDHRHGHGVRGRVMALLPSVPAVHAVDLPPLLGTAGFAEVSEVGHERLRHFGRVTLYRAVAS